MDIQTYYDKMITWVLSSGLQVLLIMVLTFIGLKVARLVTRRMFAKFTSRAKDLEQQKKARTLGAVVRHAFTISILIIAAMMILKELGIEIGPILAGAGVLGLAVGFGAQHFVQDVISGFFILFEDQIRVNDVVQIAGKSGLVEKVNLRMTVLRDLAGNVHYVRNGQIDVVTNMTKEYSRYVFEIGVAYREDVDEVMEIIREVDADLRSDPAFTEDILDPIEILGLDQFADSAIIIKARTRTKPVQQWRIGREFNRRLKKKFDERGIEIPFPHRTLYMGMDKKGEAPPVHVVMDKNGTSS